MCRKPRHPECADYFPLGVWLFRCSGRLGNVGPLRRTGVTSPGRRQRVAGGPLPATRSEKMGRVFSHAPAVFSQRFVVFQRHGPVGVQDRQIFFQL